MYQNNSDQDFEFEMRLNCDMFNYILDAVPDQIVLTLANLKPNHIPPNQQLGLIIYRSAIGYSCKALSTLLDLSVLSVNEFFKKIFRILIGRLYDQYVRSWMGSQSQGIFRKLRIFLCGHLGRISRLYSRRNVQLYEFILKVHIYSKIIFLQNKYT